MDELTQVKGLRGEVPLGLEPDDFYERMRTRASAPVPIVRRPRVRRIALRSVLSAGVAAALTIGVVMVQHTVVRRGSPVVAYTASDLLRAAAETAATRPAARAGQYSYLETVSYDNTNGKKTKSTYKEWVPADPSRPTYFMQGPPTCYRPRQTPRGGLIVAHGNATPLAGSAVRTPCPAYILAQFSKPMTLPQLPPSVRSKSTYDPTAMYDPSTWPTDPAAVLARAYQVADKLIATGMTNSEPRDSQALGVLERMAMGARTPPKLVAAVFLAAARVPGQRVERHITDPTGRPAVGVGGPNSLGGSDTMLFAPDTHSFLGISSHIFDGPNNSLNIYGWTLIVRTGVVNKVGQIP